MVQYRVILESEIKVEEDDWETTDDWAVDQQHDVEGDYMSPESPQHLEESSAARDLSHVLVVPKWEPADKSGEPEEDGDAIMSETDTKKVSVTSQCILRI